MPLLMPPHVEAPPTHRPASAPVGDPHQRPAGWQAELSPCRHPHHCGDGTCWPGLLSLSLVLLVAAALLIMAITREEPTTARASDLPRLGLPIIAP